MIEPWLIGVTVFVLLAVIVFAVSVLRAIRLWACADLDGTASALSVEAPVEVPVDR